MVFYIVSIVGLDLLIALVNVLLHVYQLPAWNVFLRCGVCAIYLITIDGVTSGMVRYWLPAKWFKYDVKIHNASKKECAFYEKLGIKNWKDKIIELGMFTNFSKKSVQNPNDREYIERFIFESNAGILGHLVNVILGFLVIFIWPVNNMLSISIPCAIVNAFLSALPFMVLRYNNQRLIRLRDILEKKEARAQKQ